LRNAALGQYLSFNDPIYGANFYLIPTFSPHGPELGRVAIVAVKIG
jgi:hypothetical protein